MTSFLALRASVCVSVVSNSPGFYYFLFFMLYRSPRFDPPLSLSPMKRSLADAPAASGEGRQFETCFDPYIIFSHLKRARFCLGASSIRSSVLRQSPGACFVFVMGVIVEHTSSSRKRSDASSVTAVSRWSSKKQNRVASS